MQEEKQTSQAKGKVEEVSRKKLSKIPQEDLVFDWDKLPKVRKVLIQALHNSLMIY